MPIWTDTTTLGDSLISQAANGVIINGNSTDGKLTLNCSATTHGVTLQSPPHSAGATYTWILPQSAGTAGQVLTSGGGATDQLTWSTNGNVGGTGTTNKLSKWSNANTLADSNVEDTGSLVTISSAAKVTGDLELDADLLDVNGATGSAGQLLSSLGTGNGVDWIDAPATGVLSIATADANVITIAGTASNPTIDANTAAVSSSSNNLATGTQIQAAIDSALAGALTFKGTFNATTGKIVSGSNNGFYLYNCPGGAGTRVAISVGDLYVASTAGSFYCTGSSLSVADEVIATADAAADSSVVGNWSVVPSSGGGITGNGTTNTIPRWDGTTVLADSVISQNSNNIGIGTTSPTRNVSISSASTTSLQLTNTTLGETTTDGFQIKSFTSGAVQLWNYENNYIAIATNNTERMRIDSSGRVGINQSSPTAGLHVVNSNSIGESIAILEAQALKNGYVYINGDDNRRKSLVFQSGGVDKFSMGAGDSDELSESSFFIGAGKGGGSNADLVINSSGQVKFNHYTSSSSFPGTAVANLSVDSSGNIITAASGGGLPTKTVNQITVQDATTGTIILSVSPTNENYTDMYVSGVYQNKSTYTLSGSTITLDGGAYFPNGAIVEVVSTT